MIKDILYTACYSENLLSKARLEKQSLFLLEISLFSILNLHSWTLNFGFCKYLCFFRKYFVQWVLRWFCFSSQGGLRDRAKSLGLGESIEIRLCREQKESSGTSVFGIKTDFLVNIGMPTMLSGKDKFQGITPSLFTPPLLILTKRNIPKYKNLYSTYKLLTVNTIFFHARYKK